MFLLFAALFLFLSFRPFWWGKVLGAWAGLSWTGFALMFATMGVGLRGAVIAILVAGLTLLSAAIAHQIIDPRFGGSYLRAAPAA